MDGCLPPKKKLSRKYILWVIGLLNIAPKTNTGFIEQYLLLPVQVHS